MVQNVLDMINVKVDITLLVRYQLFQVRVNEFHHDEQVRDHAFRVRFNLRYNHVVNLSREGVFWKSRELAEKLDLTHQFLCRVNMIKQVF